MTSQISFCFQLQMYSDLVMLGQNVQSNLFIIALLKIPFFSVLSILALIVVGLVVAVSVYYLLQHWCIPVY